MQGTHRSEFPKLFSGFHKFMNLIGLYIIVSTRHKQMYKSQNLQVEQVIHLSHWSFQFCLRNCLGCGRLGHRLESRSSEPWQKNNQKRTAERAKLQHARLAPKRTCRGHISRRERPIPTRLGTVFAMVWTKLETIYGRAGVVWRRMAFVHRPKLCLACGEASLLPAVADTSARIMSVCMQCGKRERVSHSKQCSELWHLPWKLYCGRTHSKAPSARCMELGCHMSHWSHLWSASHWFLDIFGSGAGQGVQRPPDVWSWGISNWMPQLFSPFSWARRPCIFPAKSVNTRNVMVANDVRRCWEAMRVLGICQRGGYTSLKILPVRVVARNAAPPIENTSENISSGFIEKMV